MLHCIQHTCRGSMLLRCTRPAAHRAVTVHRTAHRQHVQASQQRNGTTTQCRAAREVEAVPDAVFPALSTAEELEEEQKWVAGMVALWLDEEWTPLQVHQELGEATGAAYRKLRQEGERDIATVLLGLSSELMAFNFRDTFTSPFEVANKVVEMLMMRAGTDVCCARPEDCERLERYTAAQQQQQ